MLLPICHVYLTGGNKVFVLLYTASPVICYFVGDNISATNIYLLFFSLKAAVQNWNFKLGQLPVQCKMLSSYLMNVFDIKQVI